MNFNYYINDKEVKFWYTKGSSIMSGDEFHEFYEILYIFQAHGEFLSENEKTRLLPNMLILIPKETYHNFIFTEADNYTRCRIWFSNISDFEKITEACMAGIRVISDSNETFKKIFSELAQICTKECHEIEKRLLLRSSILRILFEINEGINTFDTSYICPQSELVRNTVSIINRSYRDENVSVAEIAAQVFVSPSQLSHVFKKELNISVYKYITLKRLLDVNKLIKKGVGAFDAARQCGFCDYSSFYRVYKKHFGYPPTGIR